MSFATTVHFDESWRYNGKYLIFHVENIPQVSILLVKNFEDSIVTLLQSPNCSIYDFAKVIAGCFNSKSNFIEDIINAYNLNASARLKAINFTFNDVSINVTRTNANPVTISEQWKVASERNARRNELKTEAWFQTSEGQNYLKHQESEIKRRKALTDEILLLNKTSKIEFKNGNSKTEWTKFVANKSLDKYGIETINYAKLWAKYMQKLISEGKSIYDIAEATSYECDLYGVTVSMFVSALIILVKCWKYGEELRLWHNKKYGHSGGGVVNLAVLTTNTDD